jgi:hypothetical protein
VQGDRQRLVFGGELGQDGVIPIQVVVENSGNSRLLVRSSDMVLILPEGARINQEGARAACTKVSVPVGMVLGGLVFGMIGAAAAFNSEEKARVARLQDYQSKEFPDAALAKGDSAHGFLYFILPGRSIKSALLQVRLTNMDDETSSVMQVGLESLEYQPPISPASDKPETGSRKQ